MIKRLTFKDIQARFVEQGREDIEICEEGFEGWKRKSKFFDKVQGEYFWSIPYRVWKEKVVHPKRVAEKRKKTILKRYGVEHQSQSQEVKNKISKSHLENFADSDKAAKIKQKRRKGCIVKYGVDNVAKSKEIRKKIAKTNRARYGGAAPSHSQKVRDKAKQTNLVKYGVDNPMKSQKIQKKLRESIDKKYGVEYIGASTTVRRKIEQTLLKKYGTANSFLANQDNVRIKETNEYVSHWLDKQLEPKPSLSTLCRYFNSWERISLLDLDRFLENYKENKTSLEVLTEELLSVKHYNKEVTQKRYKPDFKLDHQTFVNVDGLYWHSEKQKEKWYHYKLREEFEKSGLRILQFREDEIRDKSNVVKSIVKNALGKTTNKIAARKCEIKRLSQNQASVFLKKNHLMGSIKAKHVGLFFKNKLVSLLSWKCRGNVCKIERFCSETGCSIAGGFSKLLASLERNELGNHITEIHNWVDLRYGTGNHLSNKGFKIIKETLGWKWTDYNQTYNRLSCKANMDKRGLSQADYAGELGWVKIYDAGQRLWTKKI